MIPDDIRLYTWVDVQDVVAREKDGGRLPPWFLGARSYFDGLRIEVAEGEANSATQWVIQLFSPRVRENGNGPSLILESIAGHERVLPVSIEETTPEARAEMWPPSFGRPPIIVPEPARPTEEVRRSRPCVVAFHSFKGGVGRTTLALATSLEIAKSRRVLLIDGDFEAPGISWLLKTRLPSPSISFADLLSLMQGDASANGVETLQLVADRLQDSILDNCILLPAFRSVIGLETLEIRPEQAALGRPKFFLTSFLQDLATRMSAECVVVDLRAGASELAAGLLLDPRVYRVFVTTLGGQSLLGMSHLMRFLASRAPSQSETDPYPAMAITQVPEGMEAHAEDSEAPLTDAWKGFVPANQRGEEQPTLIRIPFDKSLQALPADWAQVSSALAGSGTTRQAEQLLDWLPLGQGSEATASGGRREGRGALQEFARQRIFGERSGKLSFLQTPPLRALVSDHRAAPPALVVVGDKGSGKTFTFLQLALSGKWGAFAKLLEFGSGGFDVPIIPALLPSNLSGILRTKLSTAIGVGLDSGPPALERGVNAYLTDQSQSRSEGDWLDAWLNVVAWSAGLRGTGGREGRAAIQALPPRPQFIAVMDGLEELYPDLAADPASQLATRVLLRDVPQWLAQVPGRPMGIIIFARRDYVEGALKQNSAQFFSRYDPYALKWNPVEALRLALWMGVKSGALSKPTSIESLPEGQLINALIPLWGKKLGSDESREASSAEWVLSALSDLKNGIQARDMIRFLANAAGESLQQGAVSFTDRILTPSAIRKVIPTCSREKVREVAEEDAVLGRIFRKIQVAPTQKLKNPFGPELDELGAEDLTILQDRGVIQRDQKTGQYWVAPIYLYGLNFKYSGAGRHRNIKLRW